jgi:ubiquinone/menaquinone biosynthesis C-methylase UbiE
MAAWWGLIKLGFRLLYNELAFTYDWVSWVVSLGAWRCWQRSALQNLVMPHGAAILELAHGTGNLQLDLHTAGYEVFGHDLSANMGRITQSKLTRQGFSARLSQGRAQQLPYASGQIAAVISTFPTSFILEAETLREVYRVLQADGQFLIVPNGKFTTRGAAEAGLEWLYHVTGQRDETQFDVIAFFNKYGFEVEIVEERCPRSMATVIIASKKGSGIL